MSLQQSILTLAARGWSRRRIARELDVDRETVGRYLRLAGEKAAKPAIAPPGSEEGLDSKPAIVPLGSGPGRSSHCEPWRTPILVAVEAGLSAQRIYQDLVRERQFSGSYDSVKRFVRRLLPQTQLPFRRMEVEPGAEAQVDFGQGAWVIDADGRKRRPHLLRVVLSHSRKAYSEVVWRQTTIGDEGLRTHLRDQHSTAMAKWVSFSEPESVVKNSIETTARRQIHTLSASDGERDQGRGVPHFPPHSPISK